MNPIQDPSLDAELLLNIGREYALQVSEINREYVPDLALSRVLSARSAALEKIKAVLKKDVLGQ